MSEPFLDKLMSTTSEPTIDELKGHLALAISLFKCVCDQSGINAAETMIDVDVNEKFAGRKSLGELLRNWVEISQ